MTFDFDELTITDLQHPDAETRVINASYRQQRPFLCFTFDFATCELRNVSTDAELLSEALENHSAVNALDLIAQILKRVAEIAFD